MIYWQARNNSTFTSHRRTANTMLAAVRDARRFHANDLYGEGIITYFDSFTSEWPIRRDELSIHTGYKWRIEKDREVLD